MFPWKNFKYIFGRFFCWHFFILFVANGIARALLHIVNLHYERTLKNAGIATKQADNFNKLLSNTEYINEYFTIFDVMLTLLALAIGIIGFYYSIVFAMKRTLFCPYNFIKLNIPFDKKIPWSHLTFIAIGVVLADYILPLITDVINEHIFSGVFENKFVVTFLNGCIYAASNLIGVYFVLQLYLNKNANIECLTNTENKDS